MEDCKDHGACPSVAMSVEEIQAAYKVLRPAWQLDLDQPNKIRRDFKFNNFIKAHEFVCKVAEIAEEQNHHPDINYGWGFASITYYTHNAAGLTYMDFAAAAKTDEIAGL